VTTEQIWLHDRCERLQTWTTQYQLPRIPLSQALHEALRQGLMVGTPQGAKAAFLKLAASPGLDAEGESIYDIAVHHAAMLEVLTAYLATEGPWETPGIVDEFEPHSFLMPDGRLRRVVLASTWNTLREQEERNSWRTMADVCVTGRPMLVNALVIGQSSKGFRSSPWTRGYTHPANHTLRVKRAEGRFSDGWGKVYREATDYGPQGWLKVMQQDEAFDGLVYSFTVDVPARRKEILLDLKRMEGEIARKGTTMRRAACFHLAPCPFARVCHHPTCSNPQDAGWRERLPTT